MKFWQSFSKKSVLRQLCFVLVLFAILIPVAIWDSNTQVKVSFESESVVVISDKYNMSILYTDIISAELAQLAEPGEKVENGYDNDILRAGVWENDTWGEYIIVADLDTNTCIVVKVTDGRTLVFSRKSDKATAEDYETLLTYLPKA
ncbi:MAG: hypothetical protein IJ001_05645 [Oscillospiraceae bacterium]|nr:hypothetical protein [Oscillospiraceae bacterium]